MDAPVSEGEAPLLVAVSEHLRNARNLGIETAAAESTRARASSDMALVKAAVDELENRQTQADILNALVNRDATSLDDVLEADVAARHAAAALVDLRSMERAIQ